VVQRATLLLLEGLRSGAPDTRTGPSYRVESVPQRRTLCSRPQRLCELPRDGAVSGTRRVPWKRTPRADGRARCCRRRHTASATALRTFVRLARHRSCRQRHQRKRVSVWTCAWYRNRSFSTVLRRRTAVLARSTGTANRCGGGGSGFPETRPRRSSARFVSASKCKGWTICEPERHEDY